MLDSHSQAVKGTRGQVTTPCHLAFAVPELEEALEARGTKAVLLVGIEGHVCITQTALDLLGAPLSCLCSALVLLFLRQPEVIKSAASALVVCHIMQFIFASLVPSQAFLGKASCYTIYIFMLLLSSLQCCLQSADMTRMLNNVFFSCY